MFKKVSAFIISVTFILSVIMPFTSVRAANIILSIKNQTATSITITASGMIPGVTYQFKSSPVSLTGNEQDQVKQAIASSSGTAEATFSNLILHHNYYLNLFEYNTKTQSAVTPSVANIDFKMGSNFGPVTLSIKNQTATSVTVVASGMIPGIAYQFKVSSISLDNSQDQVKQVTASSTGTAETTFSNLILHHNYLFYLFEYDTKTQSAITPSVANSNEFQMGSNFGPIKFVVKCENATSATLLASGMIPSITYQFKSTLASLNNSEDQIKQITASSTGTAETTFSNLTLHRSYSFYLFEYDTKTQSAVTPSVANIDFEAGLNTLNNLCSSLIKITSFSPASGKAGDIITITGTNFVGVNNIYFGTAKAVTTTNSPTEITVKVPVGATSGKIKIETTNYGNAVSTNDFTITSTTGAVTSTSTAGTNTGINTGNSSGTVKFSGLVPVCNTIIDPVTSTYSDPCDFTMVMALINTVISFLLIDMATPLFALILIYVGWLYLSAGDSSENVTKAKKILKNAVIGYIIALAAFLIVKTILSSLGFVGDSFLG